jgi:hypothetical protein
MKARRIIRRLAASCVGSYSRASDRPFEALKKHSHQRAMAALGTTLM